MRKKRRLLPMFLGVGMLSGTTLGIVTQNPTLIPMGMLIGLATTAYLLEL